MIEVDEEDICEEAKWLWPDYTWSVCHPPNEDCIIITASYVTPHVQVTQVQVLTGLDLIHATNLEVKAVLISCGRTIQHHLLNHDIYIRTRTTEPEPWAGI